MNASRDISGMLAQIDAVTNSIPPTVSGHIPGLPAANAGRDLHAAIIDDALGQRQHPESQRYTWQLGWHTEDAVERGRKIADEISGLYKQYMVFPAPLSEAFTGTLTLWTLHTHVYRAQGVTPYLLVSSPTAGSGKSTLIGILSRLVAHPAVEINPTPAVVRALAGSGHCLLIDEVDELHASKDFRSVLNAGYKEGGRVSRVRGREITRDAVFCPKLLAGIGHENAPVSGALLDRCIQIWLQRAKPGEITVRFRPHSIPDSARERIETWAGSASADLAGTVPPDMPTLPTPRAVEIWEPLVAIADQLGQRWGANARQWATEIEALKDIAPDANVQLVIDIHAVLSVWREAHPDARSIPVEELAEARNTYADRQLTEPLNPIQLGKRLGKFGIKSTPVRSVRVYRISDGTSLLPEWAALFDRYGHSAG